MWYQIGGRILILGFYFQGVNGCNSISDSDYPSNFSRKQPLGYNSMLLFLFLFVSRNIFRLFSRKRKKMEGILQQEQPWRQQSLVPQLPPCFIKPSQMGWTHLTEWSIHCWYITSIYTLGRATNFKGFQRQSNSATWRDFSPYLFRVWIQRSRIF